jgi:hypothetical protein
LWGGTGEHEQGYDTVRLGGRVGCGRDGAAGRGCAVIREVVLVAVLLVPTQCGYGGGGNRNGQVGSGNCEYSFEETVSGVHYRYPVLFVPSERAVYGKVLFVCEGRLPKSHHAVATLQTRRPGAGQDWRNVRREEMWRIPSPKDSLFMPGHCDARTVAYWRIELKIDVVTDHPSTVEDHSAENRIECP